MYHRKLSSPCLRGDFPLSIGVFEISSKPGRWLATGKATVSACLLQRVDLLFFAISELGRTTPRLDPRIPEKAFCELAMG